MSSQFAMFLPPGLEPLEGTLESGSGSAALSQTLSLQWALSG